MALFNVRVTDDLATRFDGWAASRGGRSAALRLLMMEVSAHQAESGAHLADAPRTLKLTVRLAPSDGVGLAAEAAAAGLSPNGWAAGLIRHRLHGRPTFARADHFALIAIQAEYRRIGVNINQIARALNTAVLEGKVLDLELAYLEDLRAELRVHLSTVREAFAGNLAYWEVEA